jgi:glycosyltransferase involved in cell wall biosynthesis
LDTTRLSIVIPCFNETATLQRTIARVLASDTAGMEKELIIVDDGSTDGSRELMKGLAAENDSIKALFHEHNQGKGAAVRTGFAAATGGIVLIQDADLEYNPADYPKLLGPILDGRADVVYGSRFRGGEEGRVFFFWHSVANRGLTLLSNMFTNLTLSDMETGYKVMSKEVLDQLSLRQNRFGIEPEMTAKIARLKPTPAIYEVGISYSGRTYAEGKKIGWKDGVQAVYCILRYNLFG